MSIELIWNQTIEETREKLALSEVSVNAWLKHLEILENDKEKHVLVLGAPYITEAMLYLKL